MPNLPNLSSSRAFLSQSPNSFGYNGSDFRDRIRENLQNTPRKDKNFTNRSIDLSLTRENSAFRPVSRMKSQNKAPTISDLDSELINTKSRRRELLFYNKNDQQNQSSENNIENQENFDFLNSEQNKIDNGSNENSYTSRRKRFEDNNFKQQSKSFTENDLLFTERVQTARDSARTPIVKPRKIYNNDLENDGSLRINVKTPLKPRNHDANENDSFPGISSNFHEESNKTHRNHRAINSENITNNRSHENSENDYNILRSSSRSNLNNDPPMPVPTPRKRDVSTKLLPTDTTDFRIKRISSVTSSKLITPRSSYQPSTPRRNPQINDQLDTQSNENRLSDIGDRKINQVHKYATQGERSSRILPDNFETEESSENNFFKRDRREPTARRRESTKIDIGLESKLEAKNSSKSRLTFD